MHEYEMKSDANQSLGHIDLQTQVGQEAHLFHMNGTRPPHATVVAK